jgi:hypothetical protein
VRYTVWLRLGVTERETGVGRSYRGTIGFSSLLNLAIEFSKNSICGVLVLGYDITA